MNDNPLAPGAVAHYHGCLTNMHGIYAVAGRCACSRWPHEDGKPKWAIRDGHYSIDHVSPASLTRLGDGEEIPAGVRRAVDEIRAEHSLNETIRREATR